MSVFMENENIQMVYTQPQDVPFVDQAETDPENAQYLGRWPFEQHVSSLEDPDVIHLIVRDMSRKNVGYVIIRGLVNQGSNIELFRIVITDKGFGYGKSVISLVKKWCFEVRRAHRLWLDVRVHNYRAKHIYESYGFVQEGILRECIKEENGYDSLILMSILSHEYHAEY